MRCCGERSGGVLSALWLQALVACGDVRMAEAFECVKNQVRDCWIAGVIEDMDMTLRNECMCSPDPRVRSSAPAHVHKFLC